MNMHITAGTADQRSSVDPAQANQVNWAARLAQYNQPADRRGVFELGLTLVLFVVGWLACWIALKYSVLLALLLTIPTAGLLLRLFAIQHDCGHGALFSSNRVNDWVGRCLGVLTLTPYEYWRHCHALHHASSGNLDRRGFGDIDTITVDEYEALSFWGRLRYRLYRNPFVLFGIGPVYVFLLKQRLPFELLGKGLKPWVSTLGTNLAVLCLFATVISIFGWQAFLTIHLPVVLVAASAGVWLFYVQHQYEDTRWDRQKEWKREHAALHGSSFYDLPQPLMWFSANIGVHHVHHLSAGIPFHRLPKIIRDYPELRQIGRLTIAESLRCVPLALWDEKSREIISFRTWRERRQAACQA